MNKTKWPLLLNNNSNFLVFFLGAFAVALFLPVLVPFGIELDFHVGIVFGIWIYQISTTPWLLFAQFYLCPIW